MKKTQILIIGGGLAGLTGAIHLSRKGLQVILIEKEEYPHHKVCGEYLSLEILPYLKSLGINLETINPINIDRLEYSSISGKTISSSLEMGGLGISRYTLDNFLYEKAKNSGCDILKDTAVDIQYKNGRFLTTTIEGVVLSSEFVIGAYGKRSNLDKKLDRDFIQGQSGWLAVKAHYQNDDYPDDLVSLHNFDGGYCGLSRTELNTVNVCYLATYNSFKNYKNTEDFREQVLMQNPNLYQFFKNSKCIFEKELTIAQVSFDEKSLIENHILMIGDSAGLIHPLCGNGMAMAIHSAKIISENILNFYSDENVTRTDLEGKFRKEWNQAFRPRLKAGKILQKILLNRSLSEFTQSILHIIPGIMPHIINRTHGKKIHV
ncbi:MAG: NAD(P)/FAD-dependent oxidoreductase [Christiangramia sp.]